MILVLGGTSETAAVAEELAAAGNSVLVSMATEVPLNVGRHRNIRRRCGRLNARELAALAVKERVAVVVDVSHPYAAALRATAEGVAREVGIPYFSYVRPGCAVAGVGVTIVNSHAAAAAAAYQSGRSILLTIGSRNVAVYAREAQRRKVTLIVRVLQDQASIAACLKAGIPRERIVTGRGPFSVEENSALIRRFNVGVVVTKDSGVPGGFPAKQEAARREGCQLVVVGRMPQRSEMVFSDTNALVRAVLTNRGYTWCSSRSPTRRRRVRTARLPKT